MRDAEGNGDVMTYVRTMREPADAAALGPTLTHEHAWQDARGGGNQAQLNDPEPGDAQFASRSGGPARLSSSAFRDEIIDINYYVKALDREDHRESTATARTGISPRLGSRGATSPKRERFILSRARTGAALPGTYPANKAMLAAFRAIQPGPGEGRSA